MQPKTPCRPVLLLAGILMIAMTAGCASVPDDAPLPVAPDEPYTLRIVFSGLVPLVYDTRAANPESLVALIPDLSEPARLAFGAHAHGHRSRLLFDPEQVEVDAGGRSIFADGWACDCDGEETELSYLEPTGEHFTLAVDSDETRLTAKRGKLSLPSPCDPADPTCDVDGRPIEDQARDVQWMVEVDGILARAADGQEAPGLNPHLVAAAYRPAANEPNLLKARFDFSAGLLQSRSLNLEAAGCSEAVATYAIDPLPGTTADLLPSQAISREVELVLEARGPIQFEARPLGDPDAGSRPVVFRPLPGHGEIVLRIDNEPSFESCEELAAEMLRLEEEADTGKAAGEHGHLAAFHFLTLYNLVDDPDQLADLLGDLPLVPRMVTNGPSWNGQCSPPSFQMP